MKPHKKILMYLFLFLISIVFAFPFYFLIVSATNASIDVTSGRLLPGAHLLENWKSLMAQTDLMGAFINSALVALCQTVLALLLSSMASNKLKIKSDNLDR